MPARTYPPRVSPARISGRALRSYRVATVAEVDLALLAVSGWLGAQLVKAPEFGATYLARFRYDVDQLLDVRLTLMKVVST